VNALVAAGAAALVAGAKVEAAGDGTVRIMAGVHPLGIVKEAVDNSAGGAAARVKIILI
jgi:hypothetical protein